MELINSLVLFTIGFYILVKGAQILVRGATSVAQVFGLSQWFIGVIIVGIGTSIPELSINLASVFNGNNVGLGAIIGSNIFTLLFILGLVALFQPIVIRRDWAFKDFPINIGSVAIAAGAILLPIAGPAFIGITRVEGLILFSLFIIWVLFMLSRRQSVEGGIDFRVFTVFTSIALILAGIIGVFVGGKWVVEGAKTIALLFGVAPAIIGLTIVAVGTSLPELTVSIVALIKGRMGIAVGNVLGSNIFTFFGVLGFTALVQPIPIFEVIQYDILAAFAAAIIVFAMLFVGKRYVISRGEGFMFLFLYIVYLVSVFIR